jgi:hypothetical protein
MKMKISAIVAALIITSLSALTPSAHAALFVSNNVSISLRFDRSSYIPGDSGTLYYIIPNLHPSNPLTLRNITIYWPWAGYSPVDNKWQGNVSINFFPFKSLTVSTGGASNYVNQTTFAVPSWFGTVQSAQTPFCTTDGAVTQRYGFWAGCFLLGTDRTTSYLNPELTIPIAQAFYTPFSFVSQALPILTIVVLVFATAFMFLPWRGIRRLEPRK